MKIDIGSMTKLEKQLYIACLIKLPDEKVKEITNQYKNGFLDITFTVNGVELPFREVVRAYEKSYDHYVKKGAIELIDEKFTTLNNAINDIVEEVVYKIGREIGLSTEDIENYL